MDAVETTVKDNLKEMKNDDVVDTGILPPFFGCEG